MHNNIDKNKQIRKYYLNIVIFADFMPFRVRNTLLSFFLRQQKNNYSFVFTTTETTVTTYNV